MHALWLTLDYPHQAAPIGGIFHRTQAEALTRLGVQVQVVAPVPYVPPLFERLSPKWNTYKHTPAAYEINGVQVYRPTYPQLPRSDAWGSPHPMIARALARLRLPRPDLIHAHFAYPSGLVADALARRWGVPWLLTLHGGDANVYPDTSPLARRRFAACVARADAVLAVSGALAERTLLRTGREPATAPIGIDLRAYEHRPDRVTARAALGLPPEAFIVVYVGFAYAAKGIMELLEALKRLSGAGVVGLFVGDGPLLEAVRRSPGTCAVGAQPNDRVPLYLAASDVLVLPSYSEGLPTVVVEAGAACVPVIGTRVGGIPDLLAEGRGYLIAPRSWEEIARALELVREDVVGRGERADRLHAYVRAHYDVDRNAASLLRLYEGLVCPAQKEAEAQTVAGAASLHERHMV